MVVLLASTRVVSLLVLLFVESTIFGTIGSTTGSAVLLVKFETASVLVVFVVVIFKSGPGGSISLFELSGSTTGSGMGGGVGLGNLRNSNVC